MHTTLLLFWICALAFAQAAFRPQQSGALQDIFAALMQSKQGGEMQFNLDTLKLAELVNLVQKLTKLSSFQLYGADCQLDLPARHILCTGSFFPQSNLKLSGSLVIKYFVDSKSYGFAMDVQVNKVAQAMTASDLLPIPSNSWMNSKLQFETAMELTLQAASANFKYGDQTAKAGFYLQGQGLMVHKFFELEKKWLPKLAQAQLHLEANLVFEPQTFNLDLEASWVNLQSELEFGIANTLVLSELAFYVHGLDATPIVHILSQSTLQLPGEDPSMQFDTEGTWDAEQQELECTGTLSTNAQATYPFAAFKDWWTLESAHINFQLSYGQRLSLDALSLSGISQLQMKDVQIRPALELNLLGDFYDVEVVISATQGKTQLSKLLHQVTQQSHLPIAQNVHHLYGSIQLIVTNKPQHTTSTGTSVTSGLTVLANVDVNAGSALKALLQPLQRKAIIEGLVLGLHVSPSKEIAVFLEMDRMELGFGHGFALEATRLALQDLEHVQLQSILHWQPKQKDPVAFAITGEWTKDSKTLDFEGKMTDDWQHPMNLSWLVIVQSILKLQVQEGVLTRFEVEGKSRIAFAKANSVFDVHLTATDNFSEFFLSTTVAIDGLQTQQVVDHIVNTPERISMNTVSDTSTTKQVKLLSAEIQIIVSTSMHEYEDYIYAAGVSVISSAEIIKGTQLDQRLVALQQSGQQLFTFFLHVPFTTASSLTFDLRSPSIRVRDNMRLLGTSIEVALGAPLEMEIGTSLEWKMKHDPTPVIFAVEGGISALGDFELSGALSGGWDNAFNLPGFTLENGFAILGFGPVAPYLSSFGMGAEVSVGSSLVSMHGYVDVRKPVAIYFHTHLQQLSFRNTFALFRQIRASRESLALLNHFENNVPKALVIRNAEMAIAPEDLVLDVDDVQFAFEKGLMIRGQMKLFNREASSFYLRTIFDASGVNFLANMDIKFPTFPGQHRKLMDEIFPQQEMQMLMGLSNTTQVERLQINPKGFKDFVRKASYWIPQLYRIVVTDFNFRKFATGTSKTTISVEVLFRGKIRIFETRIALERLAGGSQQLFSTNMVPWKEALGLEGCLLNTDCPGHMLCYHEKDHAQDKTCVDRCEVAKEVPFFGCMKGQPQIP